MEIKENKEGKIMDIGKFFSSVVMAIFGIYLVITFGEKGILLSPLLSTTLTLAFASLILLAFLSYLKD